MIDTVRAFTHDHTELNASVLQLGSHLRGLAGSDAGTKSLVVPLRSLREQLFLHFAREEEGLFPFVSETIPELAGRVNEMAVAHDTICGSLARMCHVALTHAPIAALSTLFDRFEAAYVAHARAEGELLRDLDGRLDAAQRARLAELMSGL